MHRESRLVYGMLENSQIFSNLHQAGVVSSLQGLQFICKLERRDDSDPRSGPFPAGFDFRIRTGGRGRLFFTGYQDHHHFQRHAQRRYCRKGTVNARFETISKHGDELKARIPVAAYPLQ